MGRARIPPIDNHRWEARTMSEVREAVRSRYANVATQIALTPIGTLNASSGCCQADGPDCGCSGSYGADDLDSVGLTESISLGCGNPTMLAQLQPDQLVLELGPVCGRVLLVSDRHVAPGGHDYGFYKT